MNLRDYLQIVNRYKLVVVVVTLVAGAASFLLAIRETPRYQASAQVLLSYENLPSLLTNAANPNTVVPPDRSQATQATLARVPAVAQQALVAAGIRNRTPDEFLRNSSVTADPSADFLSFAVTDRHTQTAELLATAYARAYVRYRVQLDAAPLIAAEDRLARRIAQLRATGLGRSRLARDLTTRREQLTALTALQTADASVVRRAGAAQQVRPRPARSLEIGLPIGLLLGLVTALGLHLLDRRTRTMGETEQVLGLPALGWIPSPPRRHRHRLALLEDRSGSHVGAIAAVRTNVDLARRAHDSEMLLVTTIDERTPGVKSNAVANLGVAFARAGLDAVLVDLDLRAPLLAALFGLEPRWGVAEVLVGAVGLDEAVVRVPFDPPEAKQKGTALGSAEVGGSLRVLPAAAALENPTDVIATAGIGVLLERLRAEADIVLVDAPPLLESSDVAALSTRVDAVVVIAHVGRDNRDVLVDARRQLQMIHATALGFIGTGKRGGEEMRGIPRLAVSARDSAEVAR
jgi:capsular polysaccharide biosynthesis protein/Mrp family chromosome partitioning ATPase